MVYGTRFRLRILLFCTHNNFREIIPDVNHTLSKSMVTYVIIIHGIWILILELNFFRVQPEFLIIKHFLSKPILPITSSCLMEQSPFILYIYYIYIKSKNHYSCFKVNVECFNVYLFLYLYEMTRTICTRNKPNVILLLLLFRISFLFSVFCFMFLF